MDHHKLQLYFFFIVLALVFVVSAAVFYPYIYSVAIALVFAVVFRPLYEKILSLCSGYAVLASVLTILFIFLTVLAPLILIGSQIFTEARDLYVYITSSSSERGIMGSLEMFVNDFASRLAPDYRASGIFAFDLSVYFESALDWFIDNLGSIISSIASIAVNFVIFLFALYYLLKDGSRFKKEVISLSPLADKYDRAISDRLELAVNSIVKGSMAVAVIQGVMTGVGFMIFGVPNPAFWGAVSAIAALIPGLGTALITAPATLYLFFIGSPVAATGLLVWGFTAVGLVDNFLGPKLIQRGTQMHSFFILLFVLGGLNMFGPIGFILGPIILSLLFALIDVYKLIISGHAREHSI